MGRLLGQEKRSVSDSPLVLQEANEDVSLALVPLRHGGFSCKRLQLEGEDKLTVRFEAREGPDWVEVLILPKEERGPMFRRLDHCAIRYRGALTTRTDERRAEISTLVETIAASVDRLLALNPGKSLAEALGRRSTKDETMVFGRDALRGLISPEIVEGAPLAEGFSLCDVYPSSYLQRTHDTKLELVLDFRRPADSRRLLLIVKQRDDTRPSFAVTTHFSVAHLAFNATDPPGADAVRALVAFVLQLRDHEGLRVVFPEVTDDVAPFLLSPAEEKPETNEVLNLAIDAECGQSCVFCSIKETAPAEDGGDTALARLFSDLFSNRQRGVRKLRVNGYDPLAYSNIIQVLSRATALGYTEAHIFSPCTRLADEAFCEEVLTALPPRRRFYVPLYSREATLHDRIVGREGAHAQVMKAIDHLASRLDPGDVWILSVATKGGLDGLSSAASFAAERGFPFYPHMPYPSFESRADRYFSAAPSMVEVAGVIVSSLLQGERIQVQGVVPCAIFPLAREANVPLRAWLDAPEQRPPLPGTEYRSERFKHRAGEAEHAAFHATSVPCPHESRCALALACPGEVLRSYAEVYGLDELRPVSLRELIEAK